MNKIWKKNIFWIIVIIVACFVGCNEEQLLQVDEFARDVNEVATGTRTILESPAGAMIPTELKIFGVLGIALASGLVNTYQEWRNRNMKKTARAIVKGIENTSSPDKATSEVKSNIADEMLKQGGDKFYARANKIVDKLKIS